MRIFALLLLSTLAWADRSDRSILQEPGEKEDLALHERMGLIPGPVGQVERVDGASKVSRAGDSKDKKSPLPLGGMINQGDRIVTEANSRVHVRFRDKTYIEMDRGSSVMPERVRRGADRESDRKDESIFRFYEGFVRFTAPSVEPWVRYYVKHNERVILLEGPTDFFLAVNPSNLDLIVHVRRGNVWVVSATRGMKTQIPEGASREIRRDNTIKKLKDLTPRDVTLMRERTTIRVSKSD